MAGRLTALFAVAALLVALAASVYAAMQVSVAWFFLSALICAALLFFLLQVWNDWQHHAARAARARLMLAHMPEGVLLAGNRGERVVEANAAAVKLFGYPPAELRGLPLDRLFTAREPRRATDETPELATLLAAGAPFAGAWRCTCRSGTVLDVELSATPLTINQERFWCLVVRDVTEHARVQADLEASRQHFRAIFERAALGVALLDLQGRATESNETLRDMLGYSAEELRGMLFTDVSRPDYSPADRELFPELAAGKRDRYQIEKPFVHKDGHMVWGHLVVSLVRDGGGCPQFAVAMVADITERRRVSASLSRHAREMAALYETSLSINAQRDLATLLDTLVGSAAGLLDTQMGGLYLLQADGETLRLVVNHNLPGKSTTQTLRVGDGLTGRVAQTGQPLTLEEYRMWEGYQPHEAGTGPLLRVLAVPLKVRGRVIGVLNISDDRLAGRFSQDDIRLMGMFANQAAIAVVNAHLYESVQRELEERKRAEAALREHATELQSRNEELDAFSHTVAHDLQNPTSTLLGFAGVLEKSFQTIPEDELRGYMRSMAQSARKMSNIIQELLLLAGVRKTEVKRQVLDMSRIVGEARERMAYTVEESHAVLTVPKNWPRAVGYGPWVEEVWVNYVSNALKYGGKPPCLEFGYEEDTGGMWRFYLRDNGNGLTLEEQSRLFIPFTRLSQARTSGHGLGLSIVQRIVDKLGGQVGVDSRVGQGSKFWFTLPCAPDEAPAPESK